MMASRRVRWDAMGTRADGRWGELGENDESSARSLPSSLPLFQRPPPSHTHTHTAHTPFLRPRQPPSAPLPPAMSLNPCSAGRLQALARAKSTALLQPYNPLNLRTGIQYLQKPLIGAQVNSWYPAHMSDRIIRATLDLPGTWKNADTVRRDEVNAIRVGRGKGAPKKGTYMTAARRIVVEVLEGTGGQPERDLE